MSVCQPVHRAAQITPVVQLVNETFDADWVQLVKDRCRKYGMTNPFD
jgi:hypothetical protein